MVFRTVRPQVDLSTCMKVPDGGDAALLIARMSPSCGSYTSSSARVGSPGRVDTSLTVWPVMKLMHSRRLGASVTNSQGKGASAVVTPLGPAQSLAPAGGNTRCEPRERSERDGRGNLLQELSRPSVNDVDDFVGTIGEKV